MNTLFNMFGGGAPAPQMPSPMNNMQNMMNQFQQFRQQFKGDPKQQVQQLLDSGRMTPQQFSQLQQMATQFQQMFR